MFNGLVLYSGVWLQMVPFPDSLLAVQFFISSSSLNSIQCLLCSLPFSSLRLHQPITAPVSGCINAGMPGFPSSLLDELKSEICSSTSLADGVSWRDAV
ncbi:hypothetical protein FCM35_KLT11969 [Carex littledalei]|uniref:Uncharacterized protein n=1 Tax=Carex littledalei TaxID=544730 RepID=A0A833QGD4_9POAL|nr:hypothetical protein FCM35_KLT11969 [Carex littledalei]